MLGKDEFIEEMIEATQTINDLSKSDEDLLRFVCEEICDRISIYLNIQDELFDERIVKIASRVASGIFTQTKTNVAGTSADTDIKSVSDNGQSVTYGDSTKNYLATVTDGEMFGGFTELLKPYRRIHVVSGQC